MVKNLCQQDWWKQTKVLALLTEWLHSVLQRASNIVQNSPQGMCNLLWRLQHSSSITEECSCAVCSLIELRTLSPLASTDIFFLNLHGLRGLISAPLLYRFCFFNQRRSHHIKANSKYSFPVCSTTWPEWNLYTMTLLKRKKLFRS